MEAGNLLDKEFKVTFVKMFKQLRRKLDEENEKLEVFNKELESIKNQTEMQNTITEIKNTLEEINNISDNTEEWIGELQDRVVEMNRKKSKKE